MDWTKITESRNLCTLCKKYDECNKKPEPHYDCWEEESPTQKYLKQPTRDETRKTLDKYFKGEIIEFIYFDESAPFDWNKYLEYYHIELNPKAELAYELWIEYYYKTEVYDRAICSERNEKGMATPIYGHQAQHCNNNAIKEMRNIGKIMAIKGIDEKMSNHAKDQALQIADNFEVLKKEYERITTK